VGSTRILLAAGVLGPVVFVVGFTLLGALRAAYDPMRQFVSLLSLTPEGWLQTVNFLVSGALIVAGGVGLWMAIPSGIGRRAIPVGVALGGLGFVIAGIFPTDPIQGYPPGTPLEMPATASITAAVHLTGAFLFFGGITVGALIGARRFARDGEPAWAAASLACGLLTLVVNLVTSTPPGTISPVASVAGLLQRISITAGLAWIALLSGRLLRQTAPAGD
jgi:hypothetical protein